MKNFRDIETLSAYLDGQLNASDAARLEARLETDPELASVMNDLRSTRSILRQLPHRKAPRNFTLTRQMVGLKPPLPRSYPLVRFATVFAAILFLCSFTANTLTPMLSFGAAAPAPAIGMGGGCEGCDEPLMQEAPATEAAAATEEAFAAEMAPASTEAPPADVAPAAAPTATASVLPTEGANRVIEPTPALKEGESQPSGEDSAAETAAQPEVPQEPPPSINWTLLFLILSLIGGVILWTMRQNEKRKWR